MTEEIKEILDDLGNKDNYIEEFSYQYKRISLYDSFQLLDYITNLQQENKAKTIQIETLNEILNYENIRNDKLQQENETLKAKLEIGKTCGFCPYYDYKSRCEKAVEYIKMYKCDYSPYELTDSAIRNVLNILIGSDENE